MTFEPIGPYLFRMRSGRPRQYDLERVLDTAMDLFWQRGYQTTSLNDLMQATALSKSSLYQVFGSKRELFMRCLERYQELTTADLWRRLESSKSGKQFLADTLLHVIEEGRGAEEPRGCMLMNTATENAQPDIEIANCVTRGLQAYYTIFRRAIENAQIEGTIARDRDVDLLADYVVTNVSGLRTMLKAGSNINSLKSLVAVILQTLSSDAA